MVDSESMHNGSTPSSETTPLRAFVKGILKGMAAPLSLYHRADMEPLPEFKKVFREQPSDEEALANDWKVIGGDLRAAMLHYEQDDNAQQTPEAA
ncbi:MAG: hypothetical protein FWC28_02475 [Proteobacteria bacterium]|nr:hypothetical protein [Cystobacterineae bacterium]MCL2259456.1 hypothetical protein [Cystobacterineae bacterium]MCL2314104.1 hypothetical protein [Pseudomonadota bacterium]